MTPLIDHMIPSCAMKSMDHHNKRKKKERKKNGGGRKWPELYKSLMKRTQIPPQLSYFPPKITKTQSKRINWISSFFSICSSPAQNISDMNASLGALWLTIPTPTNDWLCLFLCFIMLPSMYLSKFHRHEQDVTQGQFLNGVKLIWIQSFRMIPSTKLKNPVYLLFTDSLEANSWVHAFPKDISAK